MISTIEGNKYVNGMIFSIAGSLAGIITGIAMSKTKDTNVYQLCAIFGIICVILFYYISVPWLMYLCLFVTIFGIAGCYNCTFVMMELRIPPENFGSASVLIYVIGAIGCSITPSIAIIEDPMRLYICAIVVLMGLAWTLILP